MYERTELWFGVLTFVNSASVQRAVISKQIADCNDVSACKLFKTDGTVQSQRDSSRSIIRTQNLQEASTSLMNDCQMLGLQHFELS